MPIYTPRPEERINPQKTVFFTDLAAPKTLVVLMGPTGVGKTELSIALARQAGSPVISCDSRQLYRELNVGVARPSEEQLRAVPHYFIADRSVQSGYSVGRYEQEAIALLSELFTRHNTLLMVGGSGLYIDAVCYGMDNMPEVDSELRATLMRRLSLEGVDGLRRELRILDPDYYSAVDLKNPARVVRALEVCLTAGKPFSKIRRNVPKNRSFSVRFLALTRSRATLYERINARVDRMMEQGLLEEARQMLPYRHLNALKTVGYRELFRYFDGEITLHQAVELIKRNTRRYAKRQLTWFARYEDAEWIDADNFSPAAIAIPDA
ncbi:MAG: tRNA (adenosine(37)-N6)-dimethylallyltransferase MiaA [Prevotellaceae bacterium]|jgi:tRNA dimethylallyltransferase|nr:tRNA (adenosine(37)-N6)-dimethylallyltransferase MiaA [Prevotellaceae bacterium]